MPRMTVTNKNLQVAVDELNIITGNSRMAYVRRSDETHQAEIGHYYIDSAYGGVKLVQIVNPCGGVTEPLGCGYTTRRDLYGRIRAMIAGIRVAREKNLKTPVDTTPLNP